MEPVKPTKRRIHQKPPRSETLAPLPYEANQRRLYLLRGMPCPLCRIVGVALPGPLEWTGVSLVCPRGHGWSNASVLREEMLQRTAPTDHDGRRAD